MPSTSQMMAWTKQPITKWFLTQLQTKYGNLNTEWRTVTTLEGLQLNRGKADVLDTINALINQPDTFESQVIVEEQEKDDDI